MSRLANARGTDGKRLESVKPTLPDYQYRDRQGVASLATAELISAAHALRPTDAVPKCRIGSPTPFTDRFQRRVVIGRIAQTVFQYGLPRAAHDTDQVVHQPRKLLVARTCGEKTDELRRGFAPASCKSCTRRRPT